MRGDFDWFSAYDETEPEREWHHSTPPVRIDAIVNQKGQFQKYRVMDVTSGWRSIKIAPINDKTATQIVSWDQFVIGWEERFF